MPPHLFTPKLKGAQNTMPTKAELYAQMAEKVATQLTGSWQEWAGFLTTDVYKRQPMRSAALSQEMT